MTISRYLRSACCDMPVFSFIILESLIMAVVCQGCYKNLAMLYSEDFVPSKFGEDPDDC